MESVCKVNFYAPDGVADERLKFAVIAARFEDKWIFCRHKDRNTWEIPGGHRETGEDIAQTARRELMEETGATEAKITPVAVYGVDRNGTETCGMLFFAAVNKLAPLDPAFEIGEIGLFDALPDALTYPAIQPSLYHCIQGWLNMQTNAGELWDIYDANRNPTGRVHRRGDFLKDGDYHLVVHVWLENEKGQLLLTQRTPNKGFPNMWETTGGSALAGEDSLTAALREVHEETGLCPHAENLFLLFSLKRSDSFVDVWLAKEDFDLSRVILQPNETCGKMYVTPHQLQVLAEENKLVPYPYLQDLLAKIC